MEHSEFKERFLPLHPKLYRVAYALLGSVANAEDVVQECYLRLWHKRSELPSVNNYEAFAVTMVKNLSFDYLRSVKLNGSKNQKIDNVLCAKLTTSIDRQIEALDEITHIRAVIEELPDNQRTVVLLRGIDECSMEEIEQITGINQTNVRKLLSRARQFIKERINKNGF